MSDVAAAWLAAREPPAPPPALADALARAVGGESTAAEGGLAEFGHAAAAALRRALALGDQRSAAFELLLADALLTYAVEWAAETGPDALAELLAHWTPARLAQAVESAS